MKKKILFATKNNGKFKEVSHIFGEEYFELLSLNDFNNVGEIIETGSTFEENAVLKSKYVFDKFHIPTVADDSGLEVNQLNGEPGVFSARYAGTNATDEMNNNKLISKLFNLPKPHEAKFVCSAVFYDGNDFLKGFGEVTGHIIDKPRGINGFGYDPLFVPDGFSKTTAELDLEEKNKISHRAKAFKSLLKIIIARLT